MDTSFPTKRPFDHTTVDRSDPHFIPSSTKRRHHHHPPSSPATPQSNINNNINNPFGLKLSSNETLFRILCPASKTGGLIGKGGSIIRQVREETGAKIRIDEPVPGSDERVILIAAAADSNPRNNNNNNTSNNNNNNNNNNSNNNNNNNGNSNGNGNSNSNNNNNEEGGSEELGGLKLNGEESLAQKALVRVFERILKVDEERSKMNKEEGENGEDNNGDGSGGIPQGPVVCRLLAASYQIGSVLGRGGKIIEKIRLESGAQVRVMPKDQIPECAFPGDELIQVVLYDALLLKFV